MTPRARNAQRNTALTCYPRGFQLDRKGSVRSDPTSRLGRPFASMLGFGKIVSGQHSSSVIIKPKQDNQIVATPSIKPTPGRRVSNRNGDLMGYAN